MKAPPAERVPTGIEGLDRILGGGLPRDHIYLVKGGTGAGKTTLALAFALEGVRRGERVLYVTLAESPQDLEEVAASHGWSLAGLDICALPPPEQANPLSRRYTLFHPSEVEMDRSLQHLMEKLEALNPDRLVLDSLAGLRLLAADALRHRQQIQGLRQLLAQRRCTSLLLEESLEQAQLSAVVSLVHGILRLERYLPDYGPARRRLSVTKLRGVNYPDSFHDCRITTGGLEVYPRLVVAESQPPPEAGQRVSTGATSLDALLGGGLDRGYSTLLLGPSGVGKTTLVAHCVAASVARQEPCVLYLFDETRHSFLNRTEALGLGLLPAVEAGRMTVTPITPAALSPGELCHHIRHQVETQGIRLVVIDSLGGYLNAMPGEPFVVQHLHELLSYLDHRGVVTLLTTVQTGLIGHDLRTRVDLSTLVGTVILLRYFESQGRVRKALSVIKRRSGQHENRIRELWLEERGLRIGEPLEDFQGVLSGYPHLLNGNATG